MLDGSLLGTIAASAGIVVAGVGAVGALAYAMRAREEDGFERSMADLLELTSGSDHWPPGDPKSGGRVYDQPIPSEGAPVPSIESSLDHVGHSDPATGPAAGAHAGGRAFFAIEGNGAVVPLQRDRPALFRVK